MWRVDMGPNSTNTDLSLSGPATISVGQADNETVYDIDSDGKAELILKAANGTIFGDGQVLTHTNDTDMFIVAVDGVTGAEKGARVIVPNDLAATGNITGHFGIAYFDGVHPSLVFKGKAGGTKAMLDMAFDFRNNAWSLRWKSACTPISSYPNNHQIRCLDVDGDGMDEYVNGGYCLKDGGNVLWNQAPSGVVHGDRWYIGDLDPERPGLEGWGIGYGPPYDWYYYDAKTGSVLRKYGDGSVDWGRGTCGDVDPAHEGYECWTIDGLFNIANLDSTPIMAGMPPQNFRIWWDGDLLSENLDDVTISKWAYPGSSGLAFTSKKLEGISSSRAAVPLYGDMFGDWREEVLLENAAKTAIRIYTTTIPTDKRIYCLMHDPEYRNSMCEKGYQQSHMVDFYLGDGMAEPPRPNIQYAYGGGGYGGSTGAGGSGGGGVIVSGGAIGSGGTTSSGGGGLRDGGLSSTAGDPGTGGTTLVVGTGGAAMAGAGGTSASGGAPGTGGGAGGNPATGGTTVAVGAGGAGMAGAGGTSAVVPETGGTTSSGAGGAVGGQDSTRVVKLASKSGCSCALGATPRRASPGYLVALLACLVLHRRRRR
jgi:hypothetical protein